MKLQVVDLNGKKAGTVTVDDAVWGAEQNPALVAQAVRVYRSNLRTGAAGVKDRSDINRTGRKMWKQKGTGRARHGDRTAPQFVGGTKAHGPTGTENYKLRLNKKMRQAALLSVLADMARDKKLTVINNLPAVKKTKELDKMVKMVKRSNGQTDREKEKMLIVVEKPMPETIRAARNLSGVTLTKPEELNALMVLEHERLVITKEAAKSIGVEGRGKREEGRRKKGV